MGAKNGKKSRKKYGLNRYEVEREIRHKRAIKEHRFKKVIQSGEK